MLTRAGQSRLGLGPGGELESPALPAQGVDWWAQLGMPGREWWGGDVERRVMMMHPHVEQVRLMTEQLAYWVQQGRVQYLPLRDDYHALLQGGCHSQPWPAPTTLAA